jgi:hypothetical protein
MSLLGGTGGLGYYGGTAQQATAATVTLAAGVGVGVGAGGGLLL